ncbi:hypothetical protein E2562_026116 [Oryza meyeriana var. granulata]|uniref:Uncharacterized protein n=1 Tax=Oryza meyeriana var. granulata TaxID=110450 RepID=A0A6G1C0K5_9ORYZ|nr:hypothetical protein E2562_026116 [Oryza meyeriana var. granulata]
MVATCGMKDEVVPKRPTMRMATWMAQTHPEVHPTVRGKGSSRVGRASQMALAHGQMIASGDHPARESGAVGVLTERDRGGSGNGRRPTTGLGRAAELSGLRWTQHSSKVPREGCDGQGPQGPGEHIKGMGKRGNPMGQ